MSSKRLLDNSQKEEIDLSKQKKTNQNKLEHQLILVTISNKHPETDIDDHKIQK